MAIVKTAISLDQELYAQVEELAASLKVSRSRVFALAAQDYLRRQENKQLLEQINAAYDDAPDPEEDKHLKAAQKSFLKAVDKW